MYRIIGSRTSLLVEGVFLDPSTPVMRRAASTRVALHLCNQHSALHIPSYNPPLSHRTLYQIAGERLPCTSYGTPSQSKQRVEIIRRDSADISIQKRVLNVRPWKKDYTLLHAMAFVRELERRYGHISHIYLVKVSRSNITPRPS
jgi:hypothetical protein